MFLFGINITYNCDRIKEIKNKGVLLLALFMWGWEEIYFSTNKDEFLQKQNILHNQKIGFKVKVDNNSVKRLINGDVGRSVVYSRFGLAGEKNNYQLLVKKEDAEYAKMLINNHDSD